MIHDSAGATSARRRDKNLHRILQAALRLVEEGGVEGLSIQKLAAEVDYTPGALYRYFDSKDAILAQLVLRILADLRAYLEGARARMANDAPPLAVVFAMTRAYYAFAKREPRRFGLLAMTLANPRVLLPDSADADPVALEMIAGLQVLADAIESATQARVLARDNENAVTTRSGETGPEPTVERTLCLFAMLQGFCLLQKQARYAPEQLDISRLVENGTRALFTAWGARSTDIDTAIACVQRHGELQTYFGDAS